MDFEKVYLDHRAVIDQAITAICRRHRLSPADADDFGGAVRLHLIENDYAVLRKFQGRSAIRSYLFAVIAHLAQDWRNAKWGKWRPSAEARRLGPIGLHLERLIARDQLSFEEALETLRTNFQVTESREELEAMAARLPARPGRRYLSEAELECHPDPRPGVEADLERRVSAGQVQAASSALASALRGLSGQDRLILRMRFEDDFSIADIARTLHLDQKTLYRRIDRRLKDLRNALGNAGIGSGDVIAAIRDEGFGVTAISDGEILGEVRPNEVRREPLLFESRGRRG